MDKKDLILGKNALREAFAAEIRIQKIFISETLDKEDAKELVKLAHQHKVPILKVAKQKLDRLTRSNHQGVIGLNSAIPFYESQSLVDNILFHGKNPALCVCDGITDVRNFGAIARSAEIFGMHGIIIPQKDSAPINSESIKASAGALLSLPVCREKNLVHSIKQFKKMGLSILCATEKADKNIRDIDLNKSIAIVLGSEGTGVSKEVLNEADELAKIPQIGSIASLNVSVAAGIFFYEWMLQNQHE